MDGSTGGLPIKQTNYVGIKINQDSGRSGSNELLKQQEIENPANISVQLQCRICLGEEEEDNPMICPCKCAGSMG